MSKIIKIIPILFLIAFPVELPAYLQCLYSGVIEPDESLYLAFRRLEVPDPAWVEIVNAMKDSVKFNRIMPGESFKLYTDKEGRLSKYIQVRNEFEMLEVSLNGNGYEFTTKKTPMKKMIKVADGKVESSLWMSMVDNNLPLGLADILIQVFQYDIDFPTETRKGDEFTVVYEEYATPDGKHIRMGNIVSAEYRGYFGNYRAYRYEIEGASWHYYNDKGESLKKTLLRTPVRYSRISSGFTYNRRHPILGISRPHLGVDYAAPTGTPVVSAGDGIVTYRGWNGGFGNYIAIDHGRGVQTTYGHLSKFAKSVRKGRRVKQGQVIGYVGSTGLSTGPHLDYRVKRNGKFVNPLRVTAMAGKPISSSHRENFEKRKLSLLNLLYALKDGIKRNFEILETNGG